MPTWHLYIIHCVDGSLYTGIATDVAARIVRHNSGDGAKYTRVRTPVVLVRTEPMDSESAARKREMQIKRWSRIKKESLVKYGDPGASE